MKMSSYTKYSANGVMANHWLSRDHKAFLLAFV